MKDDIQPGQKYTRLTIVEPAPTVKSAARWHCLCDCGTKTIARAGDLRAGATKSCDCLAREYRKSVKSRGGRFDY